MLSIHAGRQRSAKHQATRRGARAGSDRQVRDGATEACADYPIKVSELRLIGRVVGPSDCKRPQAVAPTISLRLTLADVANRGPIIHASHDDFSPRLAAVGSTR